MNYRTLWEALSCLRHDCVRILEKLVQMVRAYCTPEISDPFLEKLSCLKNDDMEDWAPFINKICPSESSKLASDAKTMPE